VHDFLEFDNVVERIQYETLKLALEAGIREFSQNDVDQALASHVKNK
jgi:hypothetical protein